MGFQKKHNEGLPAARFFMVVASFSPLFLLWGIVGTKIVSDKYWWLFCGFLILFPNLILLWRYSRAKKNDDTLTIHAFNVEDYRDHLLTYLIATLLPFYTAPLSSKRDMLAVATALLVVIFIFWRANLHYMNIVLAFFGFNIFSIRVDGDQFRNVIFLSRRDFISLKSEIKGYRISNSVIIDRP